MKLQFQTSAGHHVIFHDPPRCSITSIRFVSYLTSASVARYSARMPPAQRRAATSTRSCFHFIGGRPVSFIGRPFHVMGPLHFYLSNASFRWSNCSHRDTRTVVWGKNATANDCEKHPYHQGFKRTHTPGQRSSCVEESKAGELLLSVLRSTDSPANPEAQSLPRRTRRRRQSLIGVSLPSEAESSAFRGG